MSTPDFYSAIIKLCGGMAIIPAFFPLLEGEGSGGVGSYLIGMEDSVDVIIQGSEKMNRMAEKKVFFFVCVCHFFSKAPFFFCRE